MKPILTLISGAVVIFLGWSLIILFFGWKELVQQQGIVMTFTIAGCVSIVLFLSLLVFLGFIGEEIMWNVERLNRFFKRHRTT